MSPLLFNAYKRAQFNESLSKLPVYMVAALVILLTILSYLLHRQMDCKRLSMCVMHVWL